MPRSSRYPPGHIWKHIFSVCVYSDLDGLNPTVLWRRNTRFVRLEDFGLSGVILYELPVFHGIDGRTRPRLTLEGVFGCEKRDYEDGMSIGDLLDAADAKLVYFPAYACTSFIVRILAYSFFVSTSASSLAPNFRWLRLVN
ncbi:hypothetical protein AN958_08042 [Leucoagaricus sp. SymC.cos]|nr:hypothetical protein AN958_08042 [Leucoagaricus sp. SymC.cos]